MIHTIVFIGYIISSLLLAMFIYLAIRVNRKSDIKYWFGLWLFISVIYFI